MQVPKQDVSPTLRALLDRADAAYDNWRAGNDGLQAANWLVVTALVREKVPDATGIRTTGEFNEDGLLRLSLIDILGPGLIDRGTFSQLEDDLAEPLMTIAEVETNPELWLVETDHDLPELPDGDTTTRLEGELTEEEVSMLSVALWTRSESIASLAEVQEGIAAGERKEGQVEEADRIAAAARGNREYAEQYRLLKERIALQRVVIHKQG